MDVILKYITITFFSSLLIFANVSQAQSAASLAERLWQREYSRNFTYCMSSGMGANFAQLYNKEDADLRDTAQESCTAYARQNTPGPYVLFQAEVNTCVDKALQNLKFEILVAGSPPDEGELYRNCSQSIINSN